MTCSQCGSEQQDNSVICSQCGNVFQQNISSYQKPEQQRKLKLISGIILATVLISGIGYFAATLSRTFHPVIDNQPSIGMGVTSPSGMIRSSKITAQIDGNDFIVPVDVVSGSRIVRFDDPEGKQNVPVLIYTTPRGKIVTAMSLSESCRSTDFYLEGNNIHCANCPSYWDMESLEAYACCQKYYPDPIPSKVVRGQIRISKDVVQNWRTRL